MKNLQDFKEASKKTKMGPVIIVLAATMMMVVLSLVIFNYGRREIQSDLEQGMESETYQKVLRVKGVMTSVEVAVKSHLWEVEERFPDTMAFYAATRHLVQSNPVILGGGVMLVPQYHYDGKSLFEAFTVRKEDGSFHTMQIASAIHDYTQKEFYTAVLEHDSAHWSEPYLDKEGAGTLITTFSMPIHDTQGHIVAVMGADLSLEWIGNDLNDKHRYPSSFTLMLSETGMLIGGPDSLHVNPLTLNKVIATINDSVGDQSGFEGRDGKLCFPFRDEEKQADTKVFCFLPEGMPQWKIAVVNYDGEVSHRFILWRRKIMLLMACLLLLLAFVTHKAIKSIMRLHEAYVQKQHLDKELNIAKEIQMSMLPKSASFPDRDDLGLSGLLIPAKSVGGDLYDYFVRDEKLYFCIGDVSGKGIPAALVMAVTHSLYRSVAAHESDPARIMQTTNESLCRDNDSCMFVTFFIGVLDLPTGTLRYCNAGHDHPMLLKDQPQPLPVQANLPLGVMGDFTYTPQERNLEPGSTLLLYTDGLTEAQNKEQQLFGLKRVVEALKEEMGNDNVSPQGLIDTMMQKVKDFVDDAEQSDDLTLLAIRYAPSKEECVSRRCAP